MGKIRNLSKSSLSHDPEKFRKLSRTCLTLGKAHKGKVFDEVPLDYLDWMVGNFKVWSSVNEKAKKQNLADVKAYVELARERGMFDE